MVDTESEGYRVAREYMIRLGADDFKDPAWVERLADAASMTVEEFRGKFGYLGGQAINLR
jgi:6-phosphofructokinase 1